MSYTKNLWSTERTEELKKLWAETRMSISEIGRKFGLSRNAIAGKIHRLGLPHHKPSYAANPNQRKRPNRIRPKPVVYFAPQPEPVVEAEFLGISLEDLKTDSCRYPKGTEAPYLFCGQPTEDGKSFCRYCCSVVYTVRAGTTGSPFHWPARTGLTGY